MDPVVHSYHLDAEIEAFVILVLPVEAANKVRPRGYQHLGDFPAAVIMMRSVVGVAAASSAVARGRTLDGDGREVVDASGLAAVVSTGGGPPFVIGGDVHTLDLQ